jgi:hypothetical protein
MRIRLGLVLATGAAAGALTALACIQREGISAPRQMLPAELFKRHVHVTTEPLVIDVPLLGGAATLATSKPKSDPQSEFAAVISDYEADPNQHLTRAARNDYAAALIYSHRYADAIDVLLQLEKDFSGVYATASNLGTAYELAGDIPNATKWIEEGIKRNPNSHDGTEWLHLAILETKAELARTPQWLGTHSVLDKSDQHSPAVVERALEYQLNERLYFIQNDDPIMCDLFYQAGVVTADPDKRKYFLQQVSKFGTIRDSAVRALRRKYGIDS